MNCSNTKSADSVSELDIPFRDSAVFDLLSVQIASALLDLAGPQEKIASFFMNAVSDLESIAGEIEVSSMDSDQKKRLLSHLSGLRQGANKTVLDFQAFDRVEQRLRNVQKSMHLIAENEQSHQPEQLDLIKSTYSMEHERTLHRMMEQGKDRVELLEFCAKSDLVSGNDNAELF